MTKRRRSPRLEFDFIFHPLGMVDGFEYETLSLFLGEQGIVPAFKLRALRRRDRWAIELPSGAFTGRMAPGATTPAQDNEERNRILSLIKDKTGAYNLDRTRDIIVKKGVTYYRRKALEQFRIYIRPNTLFVAAYTFLEAAEKDPSLIRGAAPIQGKLLKDRPLVNGKRARGPGWSERDDYVLRKWFGKWPDGKHHVLSDTQWNTVLEELKGFRSKAAVKHRLTQLNRSLKKSLMADGYINRDDVKAYLAKFLGERSVVPRFRPRLHGDYHPKQRNRALIDNEAKKRILKDPPPGFRPTTITTHLDMLAPRDDEAAELHVDASVGT